MMQKPKSILFMFPQHSAKLLAQVRAGEAPTERLYGFMELEKRSWHVTISNSRWEGPAAKVRARLRRLLELPNLHTFTDMRSADIVLVKDQFSVALLAQAKILKKRIVYLDAMFNLPKRFWRRWSATVNIRGANAVVCYSEHQANLWAASFNVPIERFTVVPYCLDMEFYPSIDWKPSSPRYVLAIGRDLGRDFGTLITACERLGVPVKLVTLPYLLPDNVIQYPLVEILENVTYPELFQLYSQAAAAVVPLKKGIYYPSGIRAVLEGAILGVPTVASWTETIGEYFSTDQLHFFEAGDSDSLSRQLQHVLANPTLAGDTARRTAVWAREHYSIENFVDKLDLLLKTQ